MKKGFVIIYVFSQLFFSIEVKGQLNRKCIFKEESNELNFQLRNNSMEDKGQSIFIPVVVHIVYSSPEQNITYDQIASQLKVINEDFNRKNPDSVNTLEQFRHQAGSVKITFFLADRDAAGNSTSGITRSETAHGPFFNDDIYYTNLGGKDAWPASGYLNVWVCDLADGVFGNGSPPGTKAETDGVVIDYRYFGTINTVLWPFDKGRTATHEIGHWLGLTHLWGEAGGCSDDDGITDTPAQFGPSSGCELNKISCGNLNMVQNFMDCSYDGCMNLFTVEQTKVMRENLFSFRTNLIHDVITGVESDVQFSILKINAGLFQIESNSFFQQVKIIDCLGRVISDENYSKDRTQKLFLEMDHIEGLFFILVKTENFSFIRKIWN